MKERRKEVNVEACVRGLGARLTDGIHKFFLHFTGKSSFTGPHLTANITN
jgi:hypothetical protein